MNTSNPLDSDQKFLVYTEVTDNPPEPTQEEIEDYAARIGIDVEKEPHLLFLAREGINHKLPHPWKPCLNKTKDVVFYLNEETQLSQWEHPMDPIYRGRVVQARSEFALNKIQTFDPLKRPPNKDLPPIKRSGGSLAPINPISSSLGKLGGFGSAAGDLRQRTPPRNLNSEFAGVGLSNNANNNNSATSLGRLKPSENNSNNIISGSSLNFFKDTDDDEESSPSLVRPQPQKRMGGLTVTGGGANFIKGVNQDGPSAGSKLAPFGSFKREEDEVLTDLEAGGGGDSDKKPIKSILVNSISRSRPKNPSDNIYELDGFSMNLEEMTDEEKQVVSQLESSTTSKSKGNVKFNLDENTELKFEMDEEEEDEIIEEVETDKTEEDEESVSNRPSAEVEPIQTVRPLHHNGSGDSLLSQQGSRISRNSSLESEIDVMNRNKMHHFADAGIIKPMQPSLEEEETRLRNFLQKEVQELQTQFDKTLQQKRKELEEEHQKKMNELTIEFKRKEEERVKEMQLRNAAEEDKRQMTPFKTDIQIFPEYSDADIAAMKKAMQDEMEAELNNFKEQLEEERKSRKEQIQKHLDETIAQLKLEKDETLRRIRKDMDTEKVLEIERAKREIKSLLQEEIQEMKTKFDETLFQRRNELEEEHRKKMDELAAEYKRKDEEGAKELQLKVASTKDDKKHPTPTKNEVHALPNYTDADIAAMKKAMHEEMESELNGFKEQLDEEKKLRKEQIQKHLEETIAQFKLEKDETLKRIRKMLEIERAKREIESLLQEELQEMKTKFDDTLYQRRKELEDEHIKKIEELTTEYRKKEEDRVKEVLHQTDQTSSEESTKPVKEHKKQHRDISLREDSKKQTPKKKDSTPSSPHPKHISRSVSTIPLDFTGSKSDLSSEDVHQRIVEDAKAFIRMQKNRLKDPSPIPNSSHLIIPTTKNNLLLFDEKLLKSASPRRPASIHSDLVSETESSGVSSLKDHRRSERKKLSKDIDDICNSLNNLDQQMKLVWSVVKEKQQMQQQPYLLHDNTLSFLNATASSSDLSALLPNTVPMILGKSASRVCASLPSSARKPLVPPPSPAYANNSIDAVNLINNSDLAASLSAGPRYSSLLTNNQTSSSQTVIDALRMSGLSATRLDCTDLLKSLEDELKEFKSTKQKMLERGRAAGSSSLDRKLSITKQNNNTSNILEKTKDLQEWLKKY